MKFPIHKIAPLLELQGRNCGFYDESGDPIKTDLELVGYDEEFDDEVIIIFFDPTTKKTFQVEMGYSFDDSGPAFWTVGEEKINTQGLEHTEAMALETECFEVELAPSGEYVKVN